MINKLKKLEEEINKCQTLEELFIQWKKAHNNEENFLETFPQCPFCSNTPNEQFKESFCKDGITSLEGKDDNKNMLDNNKIDVLFVLKESNCGGIKANDIFWFNDCVDDKEREFYKGRLQRALISLSNVNSKPNFGYINLNKRGGYSTTNDKRLQAYTLKYYPFIKKQIEILSPKYIIFCGCFDTFVNACKIQDKNNNQLRKWNRKNPIIQKYYYNEEKYADIVYIYHPSHRNSDEKFVNSLKVLETLKINK